MLLSDFESREDGPSAHGPRFMYTFYSQGNNQATAESACQHSPFVVVLNSGHRQPCPVRVSLSALKCHSSTTHRCQCWYRCIFAHHVDLRLI